MRAPVFIFIVILLFISTESFSQMLVRGPYMNMATTNSVTIRWRTDLPSDSHVKYGTDKNNLSNIVNQPLNVTEHIVTLTGLSADTKYYYSIGTSALTLQGDSLNHFRTAPVTSPNYDKPVRFMAMGDMGKKTLQQIAVREAFKKYADTNYTDGFLMLGDNAYEYGYDNEYQLGFFNYYQNDITRNVVLWPCLGNHDYANNYTFRTNYQIPYFDIFSLPQNAQMGGVASNNERYYSFNYGNIHFVNLDSYGLENVGGTYYGLADTAFSPQVLWLKNDLNNNNLPWVIVSYHHPPYCMGTHNSDAEADLVALRTKLNPILEKYNVDLVLSGHCHTYQRSNMMKNHFGLETTFDSTAHIVQNTNGRYDGTPNSCLYIKNNETKKDSGIIYMVVGSGSAIPQLPFAAWPHNAMIYSNYLDNGALYVTVQGNELNAKWLSTDTNQVVKDQFTILKNANRKNTLYRYLPSVAELKASWHHGTYNWSTGDTTRSISFTAMNDTTVYVSDIHNCITDTFEIVKIQFPQQVEEHQKLEIKLYPSPATNEIILELPEPGKYDYMICDQHGTVLMKESFFTNEKKYLIQFNRVLPYGNLWLRVSNERNKSAFHKFTRVE